MEVLLQNDLLSTHQYKRCKLFLQEMCEWMISETDVDHPLVKKELERQLIHALDIYLWCIDPILQRTPNRINQLARLWVEKKVYEREDAADYIAEWLDLQ